MDRELKIVISIFLIFLIYGLGSLFQGGQFATPLFMNQIVLLLVAILFLLLNRKEKLSWLLGLYIGVQLVACFLDPHTMGYLQYKLNTKIPESVLNSPALNISAALVYYLFFIFLSVRMYKEGRSSLGFGLNLLLLGSSIFLFFSPDLHFYRDMLFFAFLISLMIVSNRTLEEKNRSFQLISYQLFLLLTLEGMEYFQHNLVAV